MRQFYKMPEFIEKNLPQGDVLPMRGAGLPDKTLKVIMKDGKCRNDPGKDWASEDQPQYRGVDGKREHWI